MNASGSRGTAGVAVETMLVRWARQRKCTFRVDGEAIGAEEVFAPGMYLPAVAVQAGLITRGIFGDSAASLVDFEAQAVEAKDALFGLRVLPHALPSDGDGSLSAAIWVRAAQEVFGIDLDEDRPADIDCVKVYAECGPGMVVALAEVGKGPVPGLAADHRDELGGGQGKD